MFKTLIKIFTCLFVLLNVGILAFKFPHVRSFFSSLSISASCEKQYVNAGKMKLAVL